MLNTTSKTVEIVCVAVSKAACVYFVAAQADISELRFGWRRAVMKLILIAAACAASPRQLLEVAIETADSHARRLLDSAIEYVTEPVGDVKLEDLLEDGAMTMMNKVQAPEAETAEGNSMMPIILGVPCRDCTNF